MDQLIKSMSEAEKPLHGLSLTGGGYRGLFTAKVLELIELEAGKPIGRCFDLISGTSIGGIIALAVAFEVPMKNLVKLFVDSGDLVFPSQKTHGRIGAAMNFFRYLKSPKYDVQKLRDVITQLIPENAILGDAIHPVLIPAVNLTAGRPQVFKTKHLPQWDRDWKYKVIDIALATSAAPTFFPLAEISNNLYVDGGLFANNPDLIINHEATHFLGVKEENLKILSVGSTTQKYSVGHTRGRNYGYFDWVSDAKLLNVLFSSQQQFVEQLMEHKLGENYVRIDQIPSFEQANELGLDVATEGARNTLLGLAEKSTTDILFQKLAQFTSYTPSLKVIKENHG